MAFNFRPCMPDFTAKEASRVYRVGKYHALLVISAPMAAIRLDPNFDKDLLIDYVYTMVISEDNDIKMIITSEITSKKMTVLSGDSLREQFKRPFLCIFNEDGSHDNLGAFADWSNMELFCNKSFELIGERLSEISEPILLNNTNKKCTKNGIASKIKRWHFGKIIVLSVLYLLLLLSAFLYQFVDYNDDYVTFYITLFLFTPPLASIIWIWLSGREK